MWSTRLKPACNILDKTIHFELFLLSGHAQQFLPLTMHMPLFLHSLGFKVKHLTHSFPENTQLRYILLSHFALFLAQQMFNSVSSSVGASVVGGRVMGRGFVGVGCWMLEFNIWMSNNERQVMVILRFEYHFTIDESYFWKTQGYCYEWLNRNTISNFPFVWDWFSKAMRDCNRTKRLKVR